MDLGAPELLVILLIVIVLFGTSRIATIGKDLGTAIREFRKGFKDDPVPATGSVVSVPPDSEESIVP